MLNTRDVSDQSPAYQLVAADFVGHFPDQPPIEGLEDYRQFGTLYFSAFPDLQIALRFFRLVIVFLISEGISLVLVRGKVWMQHS